MFLNCVCKINVFQFFVQRVHAWEGVNMSQLSLGGCECALPGMVHTSVHGDELGRDAEVCMHGCMCLVGGRYGRVNVHIRTHMHVYVHGHRCWSACAVLQV